LTRVFCCNAPSSPQPHTAASLNEAAGMNLPGRSCVLCKGRWVQRTWTERDGWAEAPTGWGPGGRGPLTASRAMQNVLEPSVSMQRDPLPGSGPNLTWGWFVLRKTALGAGIANQRLRQAEARLQQAKQRVSACEICAVAQQEQDDAQSAVDLWDSQVRELEAYHCLECSHDAHTEEDAGVAISGGGSGSACAGCRELTFWTRGGFNVALDEMGISVSACCCCTTTTRAGGCSATARLAPRGRRLAAACSCTANRNRLVSPSCCPSSSTGAWRWRKSCVGGLPLGQPPRATRSSSGSCLRLVTPWGRRCGAWSSLHQVGTPVIPAVLYYSSSCSIGLLFCATPANHAAEVQASTFVFFLLLLSCVFFYFSSSCCCCCCCCCIIAVLLVL
jgi:hypothetical protein